MRKFGLLVSAAMLMFASVALVDGQQKKGGFGGGGGFGGFGGNRQENPFTFLNRADVKKELEVSDEQLDKVPAEMMNVISKLLTAKQFARYKQIYLQRRGTSAFKDDEVQKQLKLTADQKTSIVSILDDSDKEIAELFKGGFGGGKGKGKGGGFGAIQEKSTKIRKEAEEKIFNVLTKTQRTTWRGMIGEKFEFTQGGFGGFGGGGKGKGKGPKKDVE